MGMRCDQFMLLNEWASNLVKGELMLVWMEEVTRVYPDGLREALEPRPVFKSSVNTEESGEFYSGMFDDEYPLRKYTFADGRVYFEKVQAASWSAGYVFFLALEDEKGNWVPESLWAEEVIRAA